jgi:hypothetical protein
MVAPLSGLIYPNRKSFVVGDLRHLVKSVSGNRDRPGFASHETRRAWSSSEQPHQNKTHEFENMY